MKFSKVEAVGLGVFVGITGAAIGVVLKELVDKLREKQYGRDYNQR